MKTELKFVHHVAKKIVFGNNEPEKFLINKKQESLYPKSIYPRTLKQVMKDILQAYVGLVT